MRRSGRQRRRFLRSPRTAALEIPAHRRSACRSGRALSACRGWSPELDADLAATASGNRRRRTRSPHRWRRQRSGRPARSSPRARRSFTLDSSSTSKGRCWRAARRGAGGFRLDARGTAALRYDSVTRVRAAANNAMAASSLVVAAADHQHLLAAVLLGSTSRYTTLMLLARHVELAAACRWPCMASTEHAE